MDEATVRAVGLLLAVIHHGMGNFADNSIPAKWETVIVTGDKFADYINTKKVPA